MAILGLLGVLVIGLLIFAPQFWVKKQMRVNSVERADFPGTGGELAEHLIEHYGIEGVGVETTDRGDHYDPEAKMVRLLPQHFEGRSLTAVAIAAHEVGHALQDYRQERGLTWRNRLVRFAMMTDKFATIFFIAAPVLGVIARTPAAFFGLAAIGISLLAVRVLVHLVTLPVEYDASFGKALPILKEGGYLHEEDLPAARSVLKAAALTYVSAALMGLIDLARWIRILR
ncbi:zinc metallopeptidase [Pseudahrensia aquimaris]|uniref:Zinc metallopeptidase n=1 Tax=Pseudahrensia aquimaris TaxID=744461 RepID=A0ABW3FA60_9HYPH